MCRGVQHENRARLCFEDGRGASLSLSPETVLCELCNSRASLYCHADDAFLCGRCDKWVHQANSLALRHIRCFLCNTCQNFTQRYLIGASTEVVLPTIVSSQERRPCDSLVPSTNSLALKTSVFFFDLSSRFDF